MNLKISTVHTKDQRYSPSGVGCNLALYSLTGGFSTAAGVMWDSCSSINLSLSDVGSTVDPPSKALCARKASTEVFQI